MDIINHLCVCTYIRVCSGGDNNQLIYYLVDSHVLDYITVHYNYCIWQKSEGGNFHNFNSVLISCKGFMTNSYYFTRIRN